MNSGEQVFDFRAGFFALQTRVAVEHEAVDMILFQNIVLFQQDIIASEPCAIVGVGACFIARETDVEF